MCGRYEVHTPVGEIARRFDAHLTEPASQFRPKYNIAPTQKVPAVRLYKEERELETMTWGLLPSWAKDLSGVKPINARAETVFEKPMFRIAIHKRRCLLPADGFYEWQAHPGRKQPWHIGMTDGRLFAMGGIWEYWAKEWQDPVVSCAIIVTDANKLMKSIHDRMPVIIAREDYAKWLDSGSEQAAIAAMLAPYPAEEMRAYPVSTQVNNVKNDHAALIEPGASVSLDRN